MTARILDGKAISQQIQQELALEVVRLREQTGVTPKLVAVLTGDDPASQVYVRNKERACQRVGMQGVVHRLPAETSQAELLALVGKLNADAAVHGILVQLPLPRGLDATPILDGIDPAKDVDCFHPQNVGLLAQGRPRFLPCTPHGVQQILFRSGLPTAGKRVVIVGRSDIVGKPLALLLAARTSPFGPEYANATVTLAHSRTPELAEVTRGAEIVVAAAGQPELVTGEMLTPGATVIDVGVNRVGDKLVGDVEFASASRVAGAITPVPGGVGPLTIAMLLGNTLTAARLAAGL